VIVKRASCLIAAAIWLIAARATAQDISVANKSSYLGDERWEWTIYLKGASDALQQISYVEYQLHPTFPQPLVRVDRLKDSTRPYDPAAPFGLTATGWGVFEVGVKITLLDGRSRTLSHKLQFVPRPEPACTSTFEINQESYTAVPAAWFKDPGVYVYVGDIKDKWQKTPATVVLFVGDRGTWGNAGKIKEYDFNKKVGGAGGVSWGQWRLQTLKGREAIQFEYQSRPYLLSVVKLNTTPFSDHVSLQICERR